MGAMLSGNQENEVIYRQTERTGLQSKFGVWEFYISEVSRGAPQVLNGVLVEVIPVPPHQPTSLREHSSYYFLNNCLPPLITIPTL